MAANTVKSYRDLIVWQRAIELSVAIYKLTGEFPKHELYGLAIQLRRASVSIASNIAEGHGRMTTGEYKQFLGHARGSNCEVQTQLVIAGKLKYGSSGLITQCEALSNEVGKMLNAVIASL
jgi:four helix bundle protein